MAILIIFFTFAVVTAILSMAKSENEINLAYLAVTFFTCLMGVMFMAN